MLKSKTWFLRKSVSCQPAVYFYSVECFGKWLSKCLSFVDLRTFSWGQNQNLMNRPGFKHMLVYSLNMNQHQILLLGSISNRWYCAARQQSQNIWTLHPSHHQWWDAVSISTSDLGGSCRIHSFSWFKSDFFMRWKKQSWLVCFFFLISGFFLVYPKQVLLSINFLLYYYYPFFNWRCESCEITVHSGNDTTKRYIEKKQYGNTEIFIKMTYKYAGVFRLCRSFKCVWWIKVKFKMTNEADINVY